MDWFRFYSEVVRDPKVQRLQPVMFKHWVNVLCLVSDNEPRGQVPTPGDVAFHLRLPLVRTMHILDDLVDLGLLDRDGDTLTAHGWNARQYDSDRRREPEERSESGSRGNHVRWHVKGRRPVSECRYCLSEGLAMATVAIRYSDASESRYRTDTEQNRTETEDRSERVHADDPVDQIAADFGAFGKVTSGTARAIEEAVEDYGLEWVHLAVRRAAGAGFEGHPPWSYVEEPLRRWKKQGHPDEVKPDERKPMGRNSTGTTQAGDVAAAARELSRYNGGFPSVILLDGDSDSGPDALVASDDPSRLAHD